MQKTLAVILLVAFLGQSFDQGWYYFGYLVQQREYIKRCENKARPQLKCNGKCQLMKKMLEQEQKEQGQPPELKFAAKAELFLSGSFLQVKAPLPTCPDLPAFFSHTIGSPVDRSMAIFHPPDHLA